MPRWQPPFGPGMPSRRGTAFAPPRARTTRPWRASGPACALRHTGLERWRLVITARICWPMQHGRQTQKHVFCASIMAVKHGTQQQRYALKGASNDTTDTADMTRPWRTFRKLVERGAPQPGVLAVGCQHVVELRTRSCARSPRAPHVLSAQRQAFCSRRPAQWRQDIHLHEKTPCEPRSAATPTPTALAAAHTWHKVFAAGERTKLRRATHAQHCMQLPALPGAGRTRGPQEACALVNDRSSTYRSTALSSAIVELELSPKSITTWAAHRALYSELRRGLCRGGAGDLAISSKLPRKRHDAQQGRRMAQHISVACVVRPALPARCRPPARAGWRWSGRRAPRRRRAAPPLRARSPAAAPCALHKQRAGTSDMRLHLQQMACGCVPTLAQGSAKQSMPLGMH